MENLRDYAFRIYPEVADTCMALQDRHGCDVCMLLFCCWAGSVGAGPGTGAMRAASELSRHWSIGVVQPLRLARRSLAIAAPGDGVDQGACNALARQIAELELTAETMQLQQLQAILPGDAAARADRLQRCAGALSDYLKCSGTVPDTDCLDLLSTLLCKVVPEPDRARARQALSATMA